MESGSRGRCRFVARLICIVTARSSCPAIHCNPSSRPPAPPRPTYLVRRPPAPGGLRSGGRLRGPRARRLGALRLNREFFIARRSLRVRRPPPRVASSLPRRARAPILARNLGRDERTREQALERGNRDANSSATSVCRRQSRASCRAVSR